MQAVLDSALRRSLVCAVGTVVFATAAQAQTSDAVRGAPSEANHFIATPEGWVHPRTSWGDPDIQATLNQMQAAGVPLERCLAGTRGRGGAVCDPDKVWNTEEEYQARVEAARAVELEHCRDVAIHASVGQILRHQGADLIMQGQATLVAAHTFPKVDGLDQG